MIDGSELKHIGAVVDADVVLEDRWKAHVQKLIAWIRQLFELETT